MDEEKTIKKFLELIAFPHMCQFKEERTLQPDEGQFDFTRMKEADEYVYFNIACPHCGYAKQLTISLEEAKVIRRYCITENIYTFDAFKYIECLVCMNKNTPVPWCPYYPRKMLGVCRGIWVEEDETKKHIANKVFP